MIFISDKIQNYVYLRMSILAIVLVKTAVYKLLFMYIQNIYKDFEGQLLRIHRGSCSFVSEKRFGNFGLQLAVETYPVFLALRA